MKKIISVLQILVLCLSMSVCVYAAPNTDAVMEQLVLDDADLLSDAEEAELNAKLSEISAQYNAQLVVGTLPAMEGLSIDEFIEFVYDEAEMGYGDNHDGVFLLVCMDPREYRILSNGFVGDAIQGGEIESIGEAIVSDLSDGNYAAAFDEFADQCAYYIDGYINGFPFNFGMSLAVALVVGLVAGFIVASILKGQLKSVHKQNEANVYVRTGSMQVTNRNEFFLYRDTTRREKEKEKSSSSSGSSRNVGGGQF